MCIESEIKIQKKKLQGRWSKAQQQRFIKGYERFGKNWVQVQKVVKTRTLTQVRSHAQKMFLNSDQNGLNVVLDSQDSDMISYQDQSMSQSESQTNLKKKLQRNGKNKKNKSNFIAALNNIIQGEKNSVENHQGKDQQTKLQQHLNLPPRQMIQSYIHSGHMPSFFLLCLAQQREFFNNGGTFVDLCLNNSSGNDNLSA